MSQGSCGQKQRALWSLLAVVVALPSVGMAYVAAVPGNMVAFQIELMLSGKGSVEAISTAISDAAQPHQPLSSEAAALFHIPGKGPRADRYQAVAAAGYGDKQPVAAGLIGGGDFTSAFEKPQEAIVDHAEKGDRLNANVTDVALRNSEDEGLATNFYMSPTIQDADMASHYGPGLVQWTVFQPKQQDSISYKGESEAEFEQRERRCLATAIYFEARGEPVRGQLAVAQVIMNRMRSPDFPDTVCGVVYQGQFEKHCQFSFACDGRSDQPKDTDRWALAQELANEVTRGEVWLPDVNYSTFYHANYVRPGWSRTMNKVDSIGNHIFYMRRHQEPYVVQNDDQQQASADIVSTGSLPGPVSPVSLSVSGVVTASATSASGSTRATNLGF